MKTKKIHRHLIFIFLFVGLSSCSNWLDIEPKDTSTETDLFSTGDGFRVALNGVYAQMAETDLYGQQLSWGFLDVLSQMYSTSSFDNLYSKSSKYFYNDEAVKPVIQSIWSKSYNSIANCNNIIQRIEAASDNIFEGGVVERKLIEGEALALRAFLHLDILRLFAPSMMKDDGKAYIPYVTTYPCKFQPYTNNKDVLEHIIADLVKAKELVKVHDLANISALSTINRIETGGADDVFLAYRGYRMNYYAICASLARAYNYAGKHKEAFDEADIVINAICDSYGSKCFNFTSSYYVGRGNVKMYDGIIFCLSNVNLWINYKPYVMGDYPLYLNAWDPSDIFDDESDSRKKLIATKSYDIYSIKNIEVSGNYAKYVKDMIPMIRLGEMYYIKAEYYYNENLVKQAIDEIDKLRAGYYCTKGRLTDDFKSEIIKDARREFIGEGQLFFYNKKFNVYPKSSYFSSDEQFILPRPDNENL